VLENHWKFAPEGAGTKVDVSLAYEFRSRMLNMVAGVAFGRVYEKMADAFEGRAKKLFEQSQQ
jgi:coenzyme Q-binding protein COQ10